MIGYKGFNSDLTCLDFQYKIGETYRLEGKLAICRNGFHFCKNLLDCFDYYPISKRDAEDPFEFKWNVDSRFCIIEALGNILSDGSKYATDEIKIVRELSCDEITQLTNFGIGCFGYGNIGHYNKGVHNTGDNNRGSYNTGESNKGFYNTGSGNHGNSNVGMYNIGDRNVGRCNVGCYNTGDFNGTDNSTGCFNTKPQGIYMFNAPTAMSLDEWRNSHACYLLGRIWGYDKESRQEWWNNLTPDNKLSIMHIPNFDAEIFYECTGIDAGRRWRKDRT